MLIEMGFTTDDFARSNWREVIAPAEKRTCSTYSGLFLEASRIAKEDGNEPLLRIYSLLQAVCYLWLRPDEKHQPFAPFFQGFGGYRSVDISDFSESHITVLKEIFDQIDDPELIARIGDVIWTFQHRGNFQYAEAAVDAYLQSGESLLMSSNYYDGIELFTRSLHLAASLGKNSKKFNVVVEIIERIVEEHASNFQPFVMFLLELLYNYRQGDAIKNALVAEAFAKYDLERNECYLARDHWNAAARWHRLSGNEESTLNCQLKEAECYVFEANNAVSNSQDMRYSVAAHHIQRAIEALRKIPGTEDRQKELHKKMLEIQAHSHNELSKISQEVDITPEVEKAIKAVKGKSFQEALFTLCLIGNSPRKKSLREFVEETASKHPISSLITTNIINDKGRVVGRRDPLLEGRPDEIETAIIAEMHRWAHYEQEALGIVIEGARNQLLFEHSIKLQDFQDLATNNPFVPPNRELIFARGLIAGLQGDFLESLHLLIPQVENSLRYLLNIHDIVTSKLSSEGIQEESDLNTLLEFPELEQILGEDLVFDLEGTLTSRFGFNYRNLMAHGLLDQQYFYSYIATYIWWLLLRICCLPLIIEERREEKKNAVQTTEEN